MFALFSLGILEVIIALLVVSAVVLVLRMVTRWLMGEKKKQEVNN